jgi:two-component system CheB/CheR fusion protein
MPQIVWAARPDGYIDYYNRRWYEYTGFAEGYGQESWEPILHPEDVQRCVETYFGCIRDGRPYQIEYRFKDRFRGGYRWFMGRALPIRDERGEIVRWFGTCTDIDEVKQAQAALNEADRRRSEFMALLAHEPRGPLAPLNHVLQILKRAGDNVGLVEQATDAMERQLHRLTRLVDDLLDVNRISRGKLTLRREHVELASVLHHVVDAWRPTVADSKHELVLTLPPQPVYLYADSVRLMQLFGNLLGNAAKYSEPGSRIELTVEQQVGEVMVSVKDAGIGIPPDMLTKIFEIFTQLDQSLERSQGGLGIGLMLVKQLVEMHGGSVQALSDGPGRGSEFVVRLPVRTGKPKEEQPLKTIRGGPTGHRILVVDDNRDSAGSLAALLQMTGNETHTAYNGLQALDEAARFKPQVVLLDIGLPELNGYDVCRKIRQQPWGKDVVLIALTGWGQEEDRKRSREAGFDDHLVKPVNYDALMKILAKSRTR